MTIGQIVAIVLVALAAILIIAGWKRIVAFGHWARGYYDQVKVEMKKVAWPTREAVINSTVVVGIATLAMVFIIGLIDRFFGQVVAYIFTS